MASIERNTVDQRAACHSSRSLSTIAWNWDTVGKSDPPVNSFGLRLLTQRPQVRSGSLPNATAPKGTRKTVKPLPSICSAIWLSRKHARIVTKRVPFGELKFVRELTLTIRLTENAESVPPGVFLWTPFFRGTSDTTANSPMYLVLCRISGTECIPQ